MPYEIEYLEDTQILYLTTEGQMDFSDYKKQSEEAIEMASRHDTGRFLSDIRKIINRASIGDVVRLNKLYDELMQPKTNRLALLIKKDQKDYTLIKIFELSCTVRGWNVKCFLDRQEAIRWLTA